MFLYRPKTGGDIVITVGSLNPEGELFGKEIIQIFDDKIMVFSVKNAQKVGKHLTIRNDCPIRGVHQSLDLYLNAK